MYSLNMVLNYFKSVAIKLFIKCMHIMYNDQGLKINIYGGLVVPWQDYILLRQLDILKNPSDV